MGPVIGVMVVIMVLGVAACMIGRLCSGKRIMGCGEYDIERWAERKFSSCIDGTVSPPPPLPTPSLSDISLPSPHPIQLQPSMKPNPNPNPNPAANVDS